MKAFWLSQIQAEAIVEMKLRRLQGLEKEKIEISECVPAKSLFNFAPREWQKSSMCKILLYLQKKWCTTELPTTHKPMPKPVLE